MDTKKIALIALMSLCVAACGDTSGSEPGDGTTSSVDVTETKRATLYGALPADGEVIRGGELNLIAVVESEVEAKARFLIDGAPVAEVDDAPYRITMSACELSVGNHAYIVEVTDENGNRDFVEQWFTVEGCD